MREFLSRLFSRKRTTQTSQKDAFSITTLSTWGMDTRLLGPKHRLPQQDRLTRAFVDSSKRLPGWNAN